MTTRRTVLGLAAGAALAAGTGCDVRRAPRAAAVAPGDLLVVETAGGALAALDATTGRVVAPAGQAVLSGEGALLVRAEAVGGGTRLTRVQLPDGAAAATGVLDGALTVRAVSPGHALVALAAGPAHDPYRPAPRARTTVVVADRAGQRSRFELAGNLEPEAFDVSGRYLFVLDYLPPTAPDRYRVRLLDLASGRLDRLQTRAKAVVPAGAEEEMRGQGRQAVYDPRRRQLYTLYTHQPGHRHTRDLARGVRDGAGHVHAFVHTLSLTERWAYCIDLPAPFGEHAPDAHAIALSPDGAHLRVVDAAGGAVAVIDPDALTVTSTGTLPTGTVGAASAAVTDDGRLLVGAGATVSVLPGGGPGWSAATPVRGLAPTPDGQRVYVGQDGAVVCHDLATGRVVHRTAAPGLLALRHVIPAGDRPAAHP